MRNTYHMHHFVKSATTQEEPVFDLIHGNTECTYTESVTWHLSSHNIIYEGVYPNMQPFTQVCTLQ